ncbi:MAG: glycosyltransferase [Peptostreptococcaceae bacterium]
MNKSMGNYKYISVYVRNKNITPSSYYRITQYIKNIDRCILVRELAPDWIYIKQLNGNKNNILSRVIIGILYYCIIVSRCLYFLIYDYIKQPSTIVVSKTFCPKYTPIVIRKLIKIVSAKSNIYWDFDDNIFESREISEKQAKILEEYSYGIVVTNNFLKSQISDKYRGKVKLLPTTDGDLQGFDDVDLLNSRLNTFENEFRIIWVATSGNIPHLEKVISAIDDAGEIINNKRVILTIVCNKSFNYKANNIIIRNVLWSREVAKEEMYRSHVGIMPLIKNDFTLGKGGFKLVQYISTGLPIIASKVGFNEEVVNEKCGILVEDEGNTKGWIEAIVDLSNSMDDWIEYSKSAYLNWNKKFPYEKNLIYWKNILEK